MRGSFLAFMFACVCVCVCVRACVRVCRFGYFGSSDHEVVRVDFEGIGHS